MKSIQHPRPKGPKASRLRQRKFELLRTFTLPEDGLPGTLSRTHTRCGRPSCHCAQGEGHVIWRLSYMHEGKQRLENIPAEWVAEVERRVAAGRAAKDALGAVLVANAELLALEKAEHARKKRAKRE